MAINEKAWSGGFRRAIGDESLGPTLVLALDNATKQLHICDIEDAGTDWALTADSYPSVYIHDIAHPDTYYIKMYDSGTVGRIALHASTTYIEGNNANQLVLVAGNTINLEATTYIRSEGAFQVGGNLTMDNNQYIYLRGTTEHIQANAANQLIITATNTINLVATTYVSTSGALNVGGNLTMANNAYIYLRSTTEHIQANAANQLIITATNTINLVATTYVSTSGALQVGGNLTMANNAYLYFRGTTEHIRANAANQLVLTATNTINLVATGYISAESNIQMAAGKKICYYGTTEHIAGNAANQLVLTATNTINLNATTYIAVNNYFLLVDTHDDPASPTDGMLWYDGVQDEFKGRKAGATVTFTTS